MGVAETVRVNLAEGLGIAVGSEFVRRWNGVVAEPLHSARHRWTSRIDAKNRGDPRVETLRLIGIVRARSPAVAEPVVTTARVKESVIGRTGLCGGIEFNRAHRVR